jgi:SAM-dependent methyltransferase
MRQSGQWQVAGSAPEVYERELVPAVFGEWASILVELAHPRPGERVVDVACGTGIVARIAATRVGPTGAVLGIDLNPGMLSVARSVTLTDLQSSAPLQWQEASADKLPITDQSFDIVYCQLGCSSLPNGRWPCARCIGFSVPKEDSPPWCGGA